MSRRLSLAVVAGTLVLVPLRPAHAEERTAPAPQTAPAASATAPAPQTAPAASATAPAPQTAPPASATAPAETPATSETTAEEKSPAFAPIVVSVHAPPPPWSARRPDGHGPSGVMADHLHRRGEAMLGYRYMHMHMAGMRDGTESLAPVDLFARGYKMIPRTMSMDMHMVSAMMGVTRRLTLTAMVPVTVLDMEMEAASGKTSKIHTSGLGDVEASALFGLVRWREMGIHVGAGVVFPTGSTDVRDDSGNPLPYPMQPGSGTYGVEPSVTWLGERHNWSWGAQVLGTVRVGRNDQGYRRGNRLDVNVWGARRLVSWASASVRLEATDTGAITGTDDRLAASAPMMMPTADPAATGGTVIDGYLGVNLWVPSGHFARNRLGVEGGLPFYQDLAGPQMTQRWSLAVDWQYTH